MGRGRENEGEQKIDRKSEAKVGRQRKEGGDDPHVGDVSVLTGDVECRGLKGSRGGPLTATILMEPDRLYQVSNMVSAEDEGRRRNHSVRGVQGEIHRGDGGG